MRALLIDDSGAIRFILRKMLENVGFEVFDAADGLEGLNRLKEIGLVDLVLVDWNMPNMNGIEFVQAARAEPLYNNMKIMMVSTENEMQLISKALESGANEYIMKPFTEDIVRQKLAILGMLEEPFSSA